MAETTTIKDLVNPQVMADMISAKITSLLLLASHSRKNAHKVKRLHHEAP